VADRDEMIEDYRQFTREMMLRFDRALREMRAERAEWREEMRRYRDESGRDRDEHRRYFEEIIAEQKAQRQALFRILDRLGGGGAAPA
jgi:hypothetical protein